MSEETKIFEFEYFSFDFSFIEMFQSSLNCESSLKFFSAEFSVEFSFSYFSRRLSLILLLFLGKLLVCSSLPEIQDAGDETLLQANFSCLLLGLRIRSEGSIVVLEKKRKYHFGAVFFWDSFSLFRSGQIKSRTWSARFFFLRNKSLMNETSIFFKIFPEHSAPFPEVQQRWTCTLIRWVTS